MAIANRIVARTASIFGVQFVPSDGAFPPKKKEILLLWVSVHWSICVWCIVQRLHRKRKCSTVSLACPHAHWSDDAASIWYRYAFNLAIPVLSCASILASFQESLSYRRRVCLPGNAVLTFLECLPTLSGRLLVVPRLARATLSVVDLTLGSCVCGSVPCRVASLAFCLARIQSSSSSPDGSHTTVITLFSLLSFLMDL